MHYRYKRLTASDLEDFASLLSIFGSEFEEPERYSQPPSREYRKRFLETDSHIVLVATDELNKVVGGLVAYVLTKFEQDKREVYVYDLAVSHDHQRRGIATQLFKELNTLAKQLDANTIFVQADSQDVGAVAFYRSLTNQELVAHQFEIQL